MRAYPGDYRKWTDPERKSQRRTVDGRSHSSAQVIKTELPERGRHTYCPTITWTIAPSSPVAQVRASYLSSPFLAKVGWSAIFALIFKCKRLGIAAVVDNKIGHYWWNYATRGLVYTPLFFLKKNSLFSQSQCHQRRCLIVTLRPNVFLCLLWNTSEWGRK